MLAESVRRNLARAELAWLRRGAPARTRKPKARIAAATAVVEGHGPAPDRPGDGRGGATLAPGGYAGYAASRSPARPRGGALPARGRPPVPSSDAAPGREGGEGRTQPPSVPTPAKVRSPSTLRRLLGLAEGEMAEAEADRDRLVAELAAATTDHSALTRIARALADADLARAEERWLAVAEELGG